MRRLSTLALSLALAASPMPAGAQDPVKSRLDQSNRHHEWLALEVGGRQLHVYVAYPEKSVETPAVIVIHENKGLTEWVRGVADQLAAAGVIALAPDLLSGAGPGGGKTSDFPTSDAAREAIYALQQPRVTADLDAVFEHARAKIAGANGKVAVAGFCWGGGQTLRYATHRPDLAAGYVFYGAYEHGREDLARITSPVYGFYGGNDARITAGVPATEAAMKELGKTFAPVTYEGAGHGFMRSGEEAGGSEADKQARAAAWERWRALLAKL